MKNSITLVTRTIKDYGVVIFIGLVISIYVGAALFVLGLLLTINNQSKEIDAEKFNRLFSREEREIIMSKQMDNTITDSRYLAVMIRFMNNFSCPRKLNKYATWTKSILEDKAVVHIREVNVQLPSSELGWVKERTCRAREINKNDLFIRRLVRSGRTLVFRYVANNTIQNEIEFSTDELK